MITIFHNARCQKSRSALYYIESLDDDIKVVDYLKTPPSVQEIRSILKMLHMEAVDLIRKKEALYKSDFADKIFTEEQWIHILAEHPVLIERPILIKGKVAVIGRDEESLKKIY